jgi:site-specific DNA-methyltransferase (adenine-specific)/modification methylase
LILGDCLEVLPTLSGVDACVTDPPYLNSDQNIDMNYGGGVAPARNNRSTVGLVWGYSLAWIDLIIARQWLVFCNYRMLGGLCTRIEPSTVFVWRKSNAPRMTRPVPRLDCEFIVWARGSASCGRMGEFDSLVLDVPMPQAGCFADERVLEVGSGKAAHPCQKPLAVVMPFVDRMDAKTILDPYMGSGTTGVACLRTGRKFIGIEKEPRYFDIACKRIQAELDRSALFADAEPMPVQGELM